MGMHLINRMRDDADLRYISKEKPTGKKGRSCKYSGKIILNDINKDYFTFISQDEEFTGYSAEDYSKALKRIIRLVHVTYHNAKGKETCKLYFSTDVSMTATDIMIYYRSRFQIEFFYRYGKQFTGLNDSQKRNEKMKNDLTTTGIGFGIQGTEIQETRDHSSWTWLEVLRGYQKICQRS